MPTPVGYVWTRRDGQLVSYLGIARYASADQLHQLFFDGSSKKQTYRRLSKLCEPGGKPGEGACLRRLSYRRRDGVGVPVWALAPFGRSIASRLVPWLRPPAATDIGARFLEHTLVLNDVLTGLVLRLRQNTIDPLIELPFRWLSEDDDSLSFKLLHPTSAVWLRSVLKPDAIMAVPRLQRRLFIEAETGSQSIATERPDRTGAVLTKLGRYLCYFVNEADDHYGSWYRSAFPDSLDPRLVFLVHSEERRKKVAAAVKERLGYMPPHQFKVMVLTFAEAPEALARYVFGGAAVPMARRERQLRVNDATLEAAKNGYNALLQAVTVARKTLDEHNKKGGPQLWVPPLPNQAVQGLRALIARLMDAGYAPEPAPAQDAAPAGRSPAYPGQFQ